MRSLIALAALLAALPARAEIDPALLKGLRDGGYILYFRHAHTDQTQKDAPRLSNFQDCAAQRNLSEQGRGDARRIGEHFRRLRIPVGDVVASPLCRTMDTARLAFGKAKADPAVRNIDDLRKMLAVPPAQGTNLVIASHAIPMNDDIKGLAEGEAAVIRPGGSSGFSIVGRIRVQDWQALK